MANFDYRKALKKNKSTFFSSLTEGQFSWMTQDTDNQIGSEPENTITVYMHDDKGKTWKEENYEGYGEFGGKDYYDLVAEMNGYTADDVEELGGVFKELRSIGIKLAFGELEPKNGGPVLFPALTEDPRYPKGHDFTEEAKNDPNQSWYSPEDNDDDYSSWEDQYGDEEELDEGKDEMSAEEKANVFVRENEDTSSVAEKFAQYMSNKEGKKFTVTADSVDEKSFDLDLDGMEYEGGSYLVKDNGDIVNVAAGNEVYGNVNQLNEAEGEVMVDAKLLASYIDEMVSLADDMDYTPDMVKSLQSLKSKLSGKMSVKDALDFVKQTIDITEDDIDAIEALGQATDYDDAIIAQARKIMGIDENKKSTKMTKKELKEIIKAAIMNEGEFEIGNMEDAPESEVDFLSETQNKEVLAMADMVMDALGAEKFVEELILAMSTDEAKANLEHIIQMYDLEDYGLYEAKDEEVETETEEEVDVDVEEPTPSDEPKGGIDVMQNADADLTGVEKEVQDNLEAAMEAAKKLNDEKLQQQIGNSLTFFTRQHVVKENNKKYYKDAEADDAEHIKALEKDMKDDKKSSKELKETLLLQKRAGIITETKYKEMLLILEDENIDESLKNWLMSGLIALTSLAGVGKVYQMDQQEKADRASQTEYFQNVLTPETKKMDDSDLARLGMDINEKTHDLAQNLKNTPEENTLVYSDYAKKYMANNANEFAVGMNGGIYWTK